MHACACPLVFARLADLLTRPCRGLQSTATSPAEGRCTSRPSGDEPSDRTTGYTVLGRKGAHSQQVTCFRFACTLLTSMAIAVNQACWTYSACKAVWSVLCVHNAASAMPGKSIWARSVRRPVWSGLVVLGGCLCCKQRKDTIRAGVFHDEYILYLIGLSARTACNKSLRSLLAATYTGAR